MKIDEQMMTVLTGLVVALVLGALIQETGTLSRFFGGAQQVSAKDDVLYVRATGPHTLDVIANDKGVAPGMNLRLLSEPDCGSASVDGQTLTFAPEAGCKGALRLTYCIETADGCSEAKVNLTVHNTKTALASVRPQEQSPKDEPKLRALVATVGMPERAKTGPSADPYLSALVGLIDWTPGAKPLPQTPNALLLRNGASAPDPKAAAAYLWTASATPVSAGSPAVTSEPVFDVTTAKLAPPEDLMADTVISGFAAVMELPDKMMLRCPVARRPGRYCQL